MSQLQVTGEAKIRDIQGPVVANSGVITALDGAASQYVRGDGTLADFPTSSGGGSSVSYYLNSSVSQGTIGGVAYRELSKDPIIGAGTDIAISANGYVANYLTDANDPDVVLVPGGNFNCEFYFSVSNDTGNPTTYAELYKYDGTTFTLLGTSAGVPESINQGTTIAPYYFAIPVATAALSVTDRLAIRIYVNVDGRTVTLHTENGHLCQVVTTLSKGMVSLNNLTDQSQYLATGTSGTNFAIVSSGDTHTFNLPVASATNTGKLSSTDWSTFNGKVPYTGATGSVDLGLFSLTSNIVKVLGDNSTYGGTLSIRQSNVTNLIGVGYTELFGKTNILGISFGVGSIASLSNSVLTAARTYNLPDLSGTLALLEGSQTFSGLKTFTENPIINGTGTNSAYTILQSAGTNKWRIGNNYAAGVNTFDIFAYDNTTTPLSINSNGAMTLTANVTTTGAQFVQNGFYLTNANGGALAGYTHMWAADDGINFGLRNITGGARFIFQSATSYNYTFPAATGTLALTSNLSAYLPLTGGTLTGALSGTSAGFSSTLSAMSSNIQFNLDGTFGANYYTMGFGGVSNGFNRISGGTGTTDGLYITSATGRDIVLRTNGSGSNVLVLASTGAATFSSSVTANSSGSLFNANTGGLSANILTIKGGGGSGAFGFRVEANNGDAIFRTNNFSYNVLMCENAGSVGIGTSSPSNKLSVVKGTSDGAIANFTGASGEEIAFGINSTENYIYTTANGKALTFYVDDAERMRITSGGNVGIGTSSIANPISFVRVLNISGGDAALVLSNTNGTAKNWSIGALDSGSLSFWDGGNERMRITSGGELYWNLTGTSAGNLNTGGALFRNNSGKYIQISTGLTSDASLMIFYKSDGAGGVTNTGSISTSGNNTLYNITSDYRLKEDLQDFNGIEKILAIKMYDFAWKSDNTRSYGVMAHELAEVLPYAVYGKKDAIQEDGEIQLQQVDYSKIVPILVKSIQELEARIKQLENK